MNISAKLFVMLTICFSEIVCDPAPKRYKLNLDLPEEERWVDIFQENKESFKKNIEFSMSLIMEVLPMREKLEPLIMKIADKFERDLPSPMANELKGMAKVLDIDIGILVVENILYDITAFKKSPLLRKSKRGLCTSIVAVDSNNFIWHARNLDYGSINQKLSQTLKNITIEVDFIKNGTVAYTATTYAGLTGLYTAQKPNAFTVTINERNTGNVLKNILVGLLETNVTLTSHLVRRTFDIYDTFDDAIGQLSNTPTPAPVYFIVGGMRPGEGAVITKDRISAAAVQYIDPSKNKWFLVETNYDSWEPAPKSDDRRDPAIKAMTALGRSQVNKENLYKVLSINPVLNKDTTYTTVMSAAKPDIYQTWIRNTN